MLKLDAVALLWCCNQEIFSGDKQVRLLKYNPTKERNLLTQINILRQPRGYRLRIKFKKNKF